LNGLQRWGSAVLVAIHADWPIYPAGEGWLTALRSLGVFPAGTMFTPLDDIDQCVLLLAEGIIGEPPKDRFSPENYHVALWHEDLLQLVRTGYARGPVELRDGFDRRPDWLDDDAQPQLEVTWSGWHSLDNELSNAYKAPSAVSKRLAPILAAGLYDTAIREMSVHLEVEMRRGLGGSDLYGQQLVEKLIHDLEPVMLEADLKVLRGNLRALFKFVRNEFAHNIIDISRPRALSILQELGEVYEAIVALGTITNTPDVSSE
jgi:hypothetical protein